MLRLKNIGKIYTTSGNVSKALDDINLNFEKDEFVAITGKSGSGKSTLLSVISGLNSYEEGEMYLLGKPTSHYTKEEWNEYNQDMISFIFQDYNILESFTVLENVEFALTSIENIKKRHAKAIEIVKRVGLEHRMHSKGALLSGGEKQRTVIARAIAKDSPIILADEPTGNLDSKTAKEVLELLKEVSKGKLVIIVTHNYEDVEEYATRHIRMHDGTVESDERFDENTRTYDEVKPRDKYDFSDAKAHIFREKKGKRQIASKTAMHDAWMLGVKRYSTRPKQSILMSALLSIVLITILLILGININGVSYGNEKTINDIDGRYLVMNKNGVPFTKASAEALRAKYGADKVIFSDKYMDGRYNLYYSNEDKYFDDIRVDLALAEGKELSEGREPKANFEIALSIPYSYSSKYEVGDKVYLDRSSDHPIMYVTIVGIDYYINTTDAVPHAIITNDFYNLMTKIYRNTEDASISLHLVEKLGNGVSSNSYKNYVVDPSIEGAVVVSNGSMWKSYDSAFMGFGTLTHDDNVQELAFKDSLERHFNYAVGLGALAKFEDLSSPQISLIFSDSMKGVDFETKGDVDGIEVLSVDSVLHMGNNGDIGAIMNRVMRLVGIIFLVVTMSVVLIVAMQKLLYSTRQDIAIFRTMGIDDRIVKRSTYVQLFLALLPAYIIVTIIAMLIYFTPMGYPFVMLDALGGITLFLASGLAMWMVALSYNRVLYHERINKGLRRVNK